MEIVFVYFIPLVVIGIFILIAFGMVSLILDNLLAIIFAIIAGLVLLAMLGSTILVGVSNIKKRPFFSLTTFAVVITFFIAVPLLPEAVNLDKSVYYFNWFGWNVDMRTLVSILSILIIGYLIVIISYLLKNKAAHIILFFLEIVFVFFYISITINICATSYSDYASKNFLYNINALEEYEVTENSDIYYPSFLNRNLFSCLFPGKYTYDYFEKGETVLLLEDGKEHVLVTNGSKAGMIWKENLNKKNAREYDYHFEIVKDAPVLEIVKTKKVNPLGKEVSCLEAGENSIAIINQGQTFEKKGDDENYWLIETADGIKGFVDQKYIRMVRTKK